MNDRPTYAELVQVVETQQKKIADLENLFGIFPGLICIADTDGYFKYLNPEWEKTLGYSLEELLSRPFMDYMHPDDHETTRKEIEKQCHGKATFHFENRYRCKDGSYKTLEWRATPSIEGQLFAIAIDISDRKRVEQELRESEQRYRSILQTAMDGFVILDSEGHILDVNESYCRMIGYTREEMLFMRIPDIEAVETPQNTAMRIENILKTGQDRFETRHRRKNGSIIDIEVSVQYRTSEGDRMISFIRDITEMKRQQEDIRLQSLVLDQISDNVTITDLNGKIVYVNRAVSDKIGCPKEDLYGKPTTVYGECPQEGATQREIVEKTNSDGSWRGEIVNFSKDGTKRVMDCRTQIIYNTQGVPKELCGIATDITDYKLSEKFLKESEERFRALVKNASDILVIVDPDGTQRYISPAVERITGYRPEEVIGLTFDKVIHPDDMPAVMKVWNEALSRPAEIHKIAYRHIHKTRDWVYLEAIGQSFLNEPAIRGLVASVRDITERKNAEAEKAGLETRLLQAQKMEAIGLLAGGIAHDLNNMLFPITGLSEMLLDAFPADSPWQESIEQIHKSAQRGSELVKQILAFSRQSNPQKHPLRIQPILKEALLLCRATIPQQVPVTSRIESDCGMILADPVQVQQIVMNLVTNACHAVEKTGGAIHVELNEKRFQKPEQIEISLKPGRYACIMVQDTGTGIDPALVDKIFDPYFTTKEQGKGTGIGLSVVHGIIKEYGGDILVSSELGKGTTFHVYLPLLDNAVDKPTAGTVGKHPTGSESVLLIDDEQPIVRMMQMMLQKLGYRVTAFTNGPDALNEFRKDPAAFDLVISDRSMPKMSGLQLAQEVTAIRPAMPIIICTGFLDENDEEMAESIGIMGFILKPVGIGDLSRMVRNVLDETNRR
jgi:PAS domain S-box-containing protein